MVWAVGIPYVWTYVHCTYVVCVFVRMPARVQCGCLVPAFEFLLRCVTPHEGLLSRRGLLDYWSGLIFYSHASQRRPPPCWPRALPWSLNAMSQGSSWRDFGRVLCWATSLFHRLLLYMIRRVSYILRMAMTMIGDGWPVGGRMHAIVGFQSIRSVHIHPVVNSFYTREKKAAIFTEMCGI
jgi:hypothetical protein